MENSVSFFQKLLIALCAGIFGVAIAISVQHIKVVFVPKWLIVLSTAVQLILSWGIFLLIMLFFNSELLPEKVPNDDYSALSVAFLLSSVPQVVIMTLLIIYSKEVNKWLQERYGDKEVQMPKSIGALHKQYAKEQTQDSVQDFTQNIQETAPFAPTTPADIQESTKTQEQEPHICQTCGQHKEQK
ncbi:hypothetical protein LS71_002745 [Helicobacter jaachi]|uniref:Uncharacterized protein n=1 Tax=Helicobacter jaachi TaxID=1677920 RepID=A0A4U8TCI0_9HELI|nr:hypothetical protein [Helicobacter jaachi]TLD97676.1 hypothetical protein LS71_002745 [Helicobacter jaachi]